MTARIPFSYVQARAQARLATLPRDAEWERLEATRSLSAFLEEARATALKSWVAGLSGVSDAHDIDRAIRALFRAEVETAARWVPARWQAAVRWVQWLPQLPVLDRALRSGEAPSWMANDSFLASFLGSGGDVDPAALQQAGRIGIGQGQVSGIDRDPAFRVRIRRGPVRCFPRREDPSFC